MQNPSYRAQVLMAFSAFQRVDSTCLHIPKDLPNGGHKDASPDPEACNTKVHKRDKDDPI